MAKKSESERLQLTRLIPASPEKVFSAWTDENKLLSWWGPRDVCCIAADIDLKVGGAYRIGNEFADGKVVWISGEFLCVDPPRLLVFTWLVESESSTAERVSVSFEKHPQGTELTITHELIPSKELSEQHHGGWLGCLDGLAEFVEAC